MMFKLAGFWFAGFGGLYSLRVYWFRALGVWFKTFQSSDSDTQVKAE